MYNLVPFSNFITLVTHTSPPTLEFANRAFSVLALIFTGLVNYTIVFTGLMNYRKILPLI